MPRHFLIGETSDLPRGCPAIFSTKVPCVHRSHIIGARVWCRRRAISDIVDCESTSDYARSSKPAPDIFLKAVERVAPTTAHECVVIGDTHFDGEAGRKTGIPFIGGLC